ncbi:MAG: hypothetical protein WCM76_14250 [Bacteroidota bacterium]
MKKLIIILILLSTNVMGQDFSTKIDSILNKTLIMESSVYRQEILSSIINSKLDILATKNDSISKYMNSEHYQYSMPKIKCCCCNNDKKDSTPWKDYLPLIIAILTAIFALFQMKSNHVTQSRIKWIDDLRKNICEFISIMNSINVQISNMVDEISKLDRDSDDYATDREKIFVNYYKGLAEDHKNADFLINQIDLSLNDSEMKHTRLVEQLGTFAEKSKESHQKKELEKLDLLKADCIKLSKEVLKDEWEKAKRTKIGYKCYRFRKK